MDLNKVSLIGNLAGNPESRSVASGQSIATFSLATNYHWKDVKSRSKKERVDFHRIVVWGKLAEIVLAYLKKGSKVYLEGRLQNRTWQDKNNNKRYSTEVVASDLIMLGGSSKKTVRGDETAREDVDVEEIQVEKN